MNRIVYPLRIDERIFEAAREKAEAEGEVIAVIIRRYVVAGLTRDGYPPKLPTQAQVRHEQQLA